jgi:hypothetical protein
MLSGLDAASRQRLAAALRSCIESLSR